MINFTQEDPESMARIKRTRKQLQEQQQQMMGMAMVSHEKDCDVLNCIAFKEPGKFCFKYEPDRIVKK